MAGRAPSPPPLLSQRTGLTAASPPRPVHFTHSGPPPSGPPPSGPPPSGPPPSGPPPSGPPPSGPPPSGHHAPPRPTSPEPGAFEASPVLDRKTMLSSDAMLGDGVGHGLDLGQSTVLDPEIVLAREKEFLQSSFAHVDGLLKSLILMDPNHNMATSLYESVMFAKELLNCWVSKRLSEAACESLQERLDRMGMTCRVHARLIQPKLTGWMEYELLQSGKKGMTLMSSGMKKGFFTANMSSLLCAAGKKAGASKLLDLRSVVWVQELHNGKDADFVVAIKDLTLSHHPREDGEPRNYHFRCKTDAQRQRWLNLFLLYCERNGSKLALERMSIPQRIQLHFQRIWTPYSYEDRDKQNDFLFATDRNVRSAQDDEKHNPHAGMKERFEVEKPAKFGKSGGTKREIEVDLSLPHRLSIYHLEEGKKDDIITFTRHELLDYKVTEGVKLDLSFLVSKLSAVTAPSASSASSTSASGSTNEEETAVWQRKYIFPNTNKVQRFLDIMVLFQNPAPSERLNFLHDDVTELMSHSTRLTRGEGHPEHKSNEQEILACTTVKDTILNKDVFSAHLHNLMSSMQATAQLNMPARLLLASSKSLPLTPAGDAERLKFLSQQFDALYHSEGKKEYQCLCLYNKCPILLLRAFLHAQGYISMHYLIQNTEGDLQNLGLKVVWQAFRLKEYFKYCSGKLDLHGASQSLSASAVPATTAEVTASPVKSSAPLTAPGSPSPAAPSSPSTPTDDDADLPVGGGGGLDSSQGLPAAKLPFAWFVETLGTKKPIALKTIQTLFDIAFPPITSSSASPPDDLLDEKDDQSERKKLWADSSRPIKESNLLPVLLSGIHAADTKACEHGLWCLLAATYYQQNSQQFLKRRGWQSWIVPALFKSPEKKDVRSDKRLSRLPHSIISSNLQVDPTSKKFKFALRLFAYLHLVSLQNPQVIKKGKCSGRSSILWKTIHLVRQTLGWNAAVRHVIRELIFTTIQISTVHIQTERSGINSDGEWDVWRENVFTFLSVVEDFVFYQPLLSFQTFDSSILGQRGWGLELDFESKGQEVVDSNLIQAAVMLMRAMSAHPVLRSKLLGPGGKAPPTRFAVLLAFYDNCGTILREVSGAIRAHSDPDLLKHLTALAKLLSEHNKTEYVLLHRRKLKVSIGKKLPQWVVNRISSKAKSDPGKLTEKSDITPTPPSATPPRPPSSPPPPLYQHEGEREISYVVDGDYSLEPSIAEEDQVEGVPEAPE